ncbi:hypothetical protein [Bacillus sp. AG4(2022)]|uniref:hypothetical protein n=1 Tax=Bacillus sp. AG4(2022) TaxID=2962594 RepID=UPI0028828198|nr:hypothetical protein [Bacillus sp. AG4(2022)]MDT0159258.1 hypothetical protein [Bacillus sp. AG4(2022)]
MNEENVANYPSEKCPKCEEITLTRNPNWEEEFDRLDRTYPSFDMIYKKLNNDGIPMAKCTNCNYKKYA